MPADPHKRTSRKVSTDEDIELRRARGEISCAECRRLKLKCDKKLPCSSCIRRGCPSICPNGSLSSGQGTRFVLADTSHLHTKISEMGGRIRQLEDALAIFQSGVSSEIHPLLRDELLAIKFGPEIAHHGEVPKPPPKELSLDAIDALGTLTIGNSGEAKYFGRSAGSETLLLAGAELLANDDYEAVPVSAEVAHLSELFPFGASSTSDTAMSVLLSHLPERLRAWSLCETYIEHGGWLFRPVLRDEIINDFLTPIYKLVQEPNPDDTSTITPHKLAVLYLIFSMGALLDLTLDPYNDESKHYFHLGRAALGLRSIFESPEIATVQAVSLISYYIAMGGNKYTVDSSWAIMSLACKLAQSLGLHRDPSRWNMDTKTVQRRRILFYEILCTDMLNSLAIGRPPAIRLSYVDCEIPIDEDVKLDENGEPLIGFYQWKYEFCRTIFSAVLESTLTAKPPNYETVLELDKKVRQMTLPPHLNVFMSASDMDFTPSVYMRGCMLAQYRIITLIYIHRSFFAQAMLDHPVNPLRSPYAPSFLAAYRCASGSIKACLNHFDRFPDLACRLWGLWTHLFTASIIVGTIVTRSPSSSMAPNAFIELGLACDLFKKGASFNRRARSGLGILTQLRERAFQVYSQYRSGTPLSPSTIASIGKDYGEDELALFGGQTRVVFSNLLARWGKKKQQRTSSPTSASPASGTTVTTPAVSDDDLPHESLNDVHPSLVQYLSVLPHADHPFTSPSNDYQKNMFDQSGNSMASYPVPQMQGFEANNSSRPLSPTTFTMNANSGTGMSDEMWENALSALYTTDQMMHSSTFNDGSNGGIDLTGQYMQPSLFEEGERDQSHAISELGMVQDSGPGIDNQWRTFLQTAAGMPFVAPT